MIAFVDQKIFGDDFGIRLQFTPDRNLQKVYEPAAMVMGDQGDCITGQIIDLVI